MDINVDRFLFEESQELNREYKKIIERKSSIIEYMRKDIDVFSKEQQVSLESYNLHLNVLNAYIDLILAIDRNAMIYGIKEKVSKGLERMEFLKMKADVEITIEENQKRIKELKEYRSKNNLG